MRLPVDTEAGESSDRRSMGEAKPVLGGKLARGAGHRLDKNRSPRKPIRLGGSLVANLRVARYISWHWNTFRPGAHELILQRWIVPPGSFLIRVGSVVSPSPPQSGA